MTKVIFIWLLLTGQVKYQQTMDDRKQYALFLSQVNQGILQLA